MSEQSTIQILQTENQQLREQLALYEALFEKLDVGIYLMQLEEDNQEPALRFKLANAASRPIANTDPTTIIGRTFDESFPMLRGHGIQETYVQVVRSGEAFRYENFAYSDAQTLEAVFEIQAKPLPNNHVFITFDNITERKRTEIESQARSNQIESVINAAPIMLIATDLEGTVTLAKGNSLTEPGMDSDTLIGQNIRQVFGTFPEFLIALETAQGGTAARATAQFGEMIIEASVNPALDRDGKISGLVIVGTDVTAQRQAEDTQRQMQAQQAVIDAQSAALRELSTPLIPLAKDVVIMPLVGSLDSGRMLQVMETLLEGIVEHQAETAILDVTGVPVLDTQVADALLRTARAVNLLGAEVVLTGIGAGVAHSLVQLGTDMSNIATLSNLQSGIAYALERRGMDTFAA